MHNLLHATTHFLTVDRFYAHAESGNPITSQKLIACVIKHLMYIESADYALPVIVMVCPQCGKKNK